MKILTINRDRSKLDLVFRVSNEKKCSATHGQATPPTRSDKNSRDAGAKRVKWSVDLVYTR